MGVTDVLIIVFIVLAVLVAGLYFLNKWANRKQLGQQQIIEKTKQRADVYVIDKKRDKATNVNLPKAVTDHLPRISRVMKMYFIKGKVGPQVVTLMCDKGVYEFMELKKTYKAEIAGIYIVGVKGMKSKHELKEAAKAKRLAKRAKSKEEKAS